MKVKNFIDLLNKENQEAEVCAYIGSEEGWEIVKIGFGKTIIGKTSTKSDSFILIPVAIPKKLKKWTKRQTKAIKNN